MYTPLMSLVNQHVQQAAEMIFCGSTSLMLDHFNSLLFILSTLYHAGGLPLAAMLTSDE